ncbi:hypothetical protein [Saccharopolyspora cebuensis]|uniref:Uncharacterized protein n=1 Tax=Saccharopolyspora cebuensis TaxID=418759 RepID=A0ABV4CMQ9_9PSEU
MQQGSWEGATMGRSWNDVKQAKADIDRRNGRDLESAAELAERRTRAYVLADRLAELHEHEGRTPERSFPPG